MNLDEMNAFLLQAQQQAQQAKAMGYEHVFVPTGSGLNPEKGECVRDPSYMPPRYAQGMMYFCPPDWEAKAKAASAKEIAETVPTAPVLVPTAPGLSSGTKLALGAAAGVALGLLFFRRGPRSNPTIAGTILQQLGGAGRLRAMIGAKHFFDVGGALSFEFLSGPWSWVNHVKITITREDYYDMEFGQRMKDFIDPVKTHRGIMRDQLIEVFERQTGLYLRL